MAPSRNPRYSKKPRQFMAYTTAQADLGYPAPGHYRRTAPGAPTVADLVHPGDTVRTSYDTGGIVIAVDELTFTAPTGERLPHFTIVYVPPERYGRHRDNDRHWINECVAVDGRILKLFENNGDDVVVIDRAHPIPAPPVRSILITR